MKTRFRRTRKKKRAESRDSGRGFSRAWGEYFFAPASAFFLYLALTAAENLGKKELAVGTDFLGLGGTMQNGAQMAVLGGLLVGGLVVAQQMGIAGAAG